MDQIIKLRCHLNNMAQQTINAPSVDCITPPSFDKRFASEAWSHWPYNLMQQSFLLTQQWWQAATTNVLGVSKHHEQIVSFIARQWLDVLSPGNFIATNPLVTENANKSWGTSLVRGAINLIEDSERMMAGKPAAYADHLVVGRDLAITPGKVIYRNRLVELIQYAPATEKVHPEPILIMPAWIMKYYILDLSQENSLIRYMVGQGFTVFCISWKNPNESDRNLDIDDYRILGFEESLKAINTIVPDQKIHATGYCLGGTLLAIAAAAMAKNDDRRLASLSLFTAQTDFRESGELALFIDESEVSLLEAQMHQTGYLAAGQMAGAFQMLRSNDLMWSRLIKEYLMGERNPAMDLMVWNSDTTRMPARMHSRYLRELFLYNSLSEGRYEVDGEPVTLINITEPIFCVATKADHVAPWESVFKIHYLTPTEICFVLTSGGHNAGIVSDPRRPDRNYQILTRTAGGKYIAPKTWLNQAALHEGSWWPAWSKWLKKRSGPPVLPPGMGNPGQGYPELMDAPGNYVHEK